MGGDVHDSLRKVLSYVGAEVVDEACVRLPITRDLVDGDGLTPTSGSEPRSPLF